tara:strand:+ start:19376 stop:20896 length:1521 start_codon:yes stop_codon:yes gene_type:complete
MKEKDINLKEKFESLKVKLSKQKFSEVINECEKILKDNNNPVFYNLLCLAYMNSKEFYKAIEIMQKGFKIYPNNPDFYNNLGMCYAKIFRYKIAEKYYKKGLDIDKDNLHILNNLGNLKKDLDLSDEAVKIYERILSIQPNALAVIYNLAGLLNSMGQIEKAKKLFYKILDHNPNFTEADRVISETTKYNSSNIHFLDMKNKLRDNKLDDNSLIHLHFGLAKAYNDQKKFDLAFKNYKTANDLCKNYRGYSIEKDIQTFKDIKEKFQKQNINNLNYQGRNFLFIIGMPRSGTSLTEQILSSHKNVFGGGEIPITERIYNNHFCSNENISEKNLNDAKKDYLEFVANLDNSMKFFTDKAPLNFLYVGFILKYLPNSKFINIVRDPVDNCWSMYKNFFPTKINFSYNLSDLAEYYKLYRNMIKYWKKYFPEKIFDLSYENLVTNSENEIRNLLNFCELDWDKNCLNPENNKRIIKTISYNQARQPIYKTSLKSYSGYDDYLNELKILI